MIDTNKALFSVSEAARLLRVTKRILDSQVRNGKVPVKFIGGRMLVPRTFIFSGEHEAAPAEAGPATAGERYLAEIRGTIIAQLEKAPRFGKCGFAVTFRDGKITKVEIQQEITRIAGKGEPDEQG